MNEESKRWSAKSVLVLEIIQGKTTVAVASPQFDLTPSELESWVDQAKSGMENALRAKPQDVCQQYEKQINQLQTAYGDNVGVTYAKKAGRVAGAGRELIRWLQEQFQADGLKVSLSRLRAWFGVARRSVYYRPHKKAVVVKVCYAEPIKQLIEAEPSFGYRTVAALLGMNKNTVQRVFQLNGWQVHKRSVDRSPRIQAEPSKAQEPNQRWSTDLFRVWGAQDGWLSLVLVMDCNIRELLGWQLSKTGKASTAISALEHALINCFHCLDKVSERFLLCSDNGLCLPAGNTLHWLKAMAYSRNSSPRIAHSKMGWLNV